jgi:hypothetical protein
MPPSPRLTLLPAAGLVAVPKYGVEEAVFSCRARAAAPRRDLQLIILEHVPDKRASAFKEYPKVRAGFSRSESVRDIVADCEHVQKWSERATITRTQLSYCGNRLLRANVG